MWFKTGSVTRYREGDTFIKTEDPETIWTIRRFVELSGLPRHAELTSTGFAPRTIMVSEVALRERRLYHETERQDAEAEAAPRQGRRSGRPWRGLLMVFGVGRRLFKI